MAQETYVLFRSGARLCAVPVARAVETMRPLPVEPFAAMPPFVLGVALVRGMATPVLDVGRLLGVTTVAPARFLTVRLGARVAALAVDEVVGIRAVPADALAATPSLLGSVSAELVAVLGALDAELVLVLESSRLVPDLVWDVLEGPAELAT